MQYLAQNSPKTLQGVLDSRKQLFEELLWEHRDLTEAFAALKLSHNQWQGLFDLTGFFYTDFSFDELC
jgi:hypothetical protein